MVFVIISSYHDDLVVQVQRIQQSAQRREPLLLLGEQVEVGVCQVRLPD